MLNLPILRWGKPYTSLDQDPVVHFITGETLAQVSQTNAGLVARDMKEAWRAREVLTEIPVWTPDGRYVTFASNRQGGVQNIYWKRADGTGEAERLTESSNSQGPSSWSPDGKVLAFDEQSTETSWEPPWDGCSLPPQRTRSRPVS